MIVGNCGVYPGQPARGRHPQSEGAFLRALEGTVTIVTSPPTRFVYLLLLLLFFFYVDGYIC